MVPVPPTGPSAGMAARPAALGEELLAVYGRHPWALDIPITGPPALPNQLAWLDWGLGELEADRAAARPSDCR